VYDEYCPFRGRLTHEKKEKFFQKELDKVSVSMVLSENLCFKLLAWLLMRSGAQGQGKTPMEP
jgi:hypothetical protein